MKRTHVCKVVGQAEVYELESHYVTACNFEASRKTADLFGFQRVRAMIQERVGQSIEVEVDGHRYRVAIDFGAECTKVTPHEHSILCELRDFPNDKAWMTNAWEELALNQFLMATWKPLHGFEFYARGGDDLFVKATVGVHGLGWSKVSKYEYFQGKET